MATLRERTVKRDVKRFDRDRRRHKEKVLEAIKENLEDILEGLDIVSMSPDQKIKIPLRSIKEFQFAYAERNPGAAQAPGAGKGDKLGEKKGEMRMPGDQQAGDTPGDDVYEVEIYAEELQELIDEKYNLPNLEEKDEAKAPEEKKTRTRGYKKRGPLSRLARRRTAKKRIERVQRDATIKKEG